MACGCGGRSNGLWIPQTTMQVQFQTSGTSPQYTWDELVLDVSGYNFMQLQAEVFSLYKVGGSGTFSECKLNLQFAQECTEKSFNNAGAPQSGSLTLASGFSTDPTTTAVTTINLFDASTPLALGPYVRPTFFGKSSTNTADVLVSLSVSIKLLRDL